MPTAAIEAVRGNYRREAQSGFGLGSFQGNSVCKRCCVVMTLGRRGRGRPLQVRRGGSFFASGRHLRPSPVRRLFACALSRGACRWTRTGATGSLLLYGTARASDVVRPLSSHRGAGDHRRVLWSEVRIFLLHLCPCVAATAETLGDDPPRQANGTPLCIGELGLLGGGRSLAAAGTTWDSLWASEAAGSG